MNANEAAVRAAYQVAERKDLAGWVNCFTDDGSFTDESIGVTYRGKQLSQPVEIYAAAFPDMHRELYRFFVDGDTVIVELALQGTHKGPLKSPLGTIKPTGKRMDAPCCDVFRLKNGKIQSFNWLGAIFSRLLRCCQLPLRHSGTACVLRKPLSHS